MATTGARNMAMFLSHFVGPDEAMYVVELDYEGMDEPIEFNVTANSFQSAQEKVLSRPGIGKPIGGAVRPFLDPDTWSEFTL